MPKPAPPSPHAPHGWSWWALLAWAAYTLTLLVIGLLLLLPLLPCVACRTMPTWLQFAVFLGVLLAVTWYARQPGVPYHRQLGLRPLSAYHMITWLAVGVIVIAAAHMGFLLAGSQGSFPQYPTEVFWSYMVLIVVVAPIVEELVFRGFIYGVMRSACAPWLAMAASSLGFALLHMEAVPTMAVLFIYAVVWCWIYEKTGSLYPAMILHTFNNSLAMLALTGNTGVLWLGALVIAALIAVNGWQRQAGFSRGISRRPIPTE